jgi:hypothetical protein
MNRAKSALLMAAMAALAAALIGVAAGCEDKKPTADTAHQEGGAGADKYATADPKLAKALQAAGSASASSDNGPPPDGIFPAGAADRRHPKGMPTKVDLLSDGADPKVSLAAAPDAASDAARASAYGPAVLQVSQQMSQRSAPLTIQFGLLLSPAKPDEGGPDVLLATVKNAGLDKGQGGQASADADKEISTLQGTQLRLKLSPDGMQSDLSMLLGKTSKPDYDRLAQNAAEALAMVAVPMPGKPIGVGAQWIAETRMPLSGLDVITYRAFRVKSVDGDRVHLTLDLKAYAVDKDVQLAGVPKGAALEQFDVLGQGELELVRGELLARKSDMQERVVMAFAPPGGMDKAADTPGQPPQQQMMTAQILEQATFVRGEDLRQAMKHP